LVITVVSVAGSGALCFSGYALLGISMRGQGTLGWVLFLAPLLTPAVMAPAVSLPSTRSRARINQLIHTLEETQSKLEEEIAERRLIHDELERQARRDPLTGVLNRRGFFEAGAALTTLNPDMCVLTVDIDDFKQVNDDWGHAAGDQVLRAVANSLQAAAGAGAVVARLGGDEFAAILGAMDDGRSARLRDLLGCLAVTLADGRELAISASVGFAQLGHGVPVDSALAAADGQMYSAKRSRTRAGR
jgi:diguanylate cyclase (GGDEF)-like protein